MKMQPVGDKVLVEIEGDLPEQDEEDGYGTGEMVTARVVSVGPDLGKPPAKGDLVGNRKMPKVSAGDTVHIKCHSTADVFEQDGKKLKYVDPFDVMGVMGGGPARRMAEGGMSMHDEKKGSKPQSMHDDDMEEEDDDEEKDMMD